MYLWDLLDIWGWKFSLLVRCSFPRSSQRLYRYRYFQKVSYHDLIQHDCEWLMFGVLPISFNYVDTYIGQLSGWSLIIVYPDAVALSLSLSVKVVRSTILKRPHAHAFQSGCHLQTTPIYVWFKCKFNEFRYSWYSPFCQGYYRNHLERKQPRLAVRRFSCILRRSDIYIWQPGWQLHFALWSQTVLNRKHTPLHRFNIDLSRIYEICKYIPYCIVILTQAFPFLQ